MPPPPARRSPATAAATASVRHATCPPIRPTRSADAAPLGAVLGIPVAGGPVGLAQKCIAVASNKRHVPVADPEQGPFALAPRVASSVAKGAALAASLLPEIPFAGSRVGLTEATSRQHQRVASKATAHRHRHRALRRASPSADAT
jgi:hypothetical protein